MKYYRVFAKRSYHHDGEEKVRWLRVGENKVTKYGGKYLKHFLYPETDYVILPENNEEDEIDTLVID